MRPSAIAVFASCVLALGLLTPAGCAPDATPPAEGTPRLGGPAEGTPSPEQPAVSPEGTERAEIELTSPAFHAGEPIPEKYTEDGDDLSPPLAWSGVPEGTQELVLICDDPDAPSPKKPAPEPWGHWVLYKIPPDTTSLPEGIRDTPRLDDPPGALQGKNSWSSGQTVGYRGPAPPPGSGTHRYFFKLYALDTELSVGPEADKATVVDAASGHVIGQGSLFGTYER